MTKCDCFYTFSVRGSKLQKGLGVGNGRGRSGLSTQAGEKNGEESKRGGRESLPHLIVSVGEQQGESVHFGRKKS